MSLLQPLFLELRDQSDQDIGVKGCIVPLGVSEGTPLPVRHLLFLAHRLLKYFIAHFCEARLHWSKVDTTVI